MKTIWRYEIPNQECFWLDIPQGSHVISVQLKDGAPHLWAIVETESKLEHRMFTLVVTGQSLSDAFLVSHSYVGMFQLMGDGPTLVFHLFEAVDMGERRIAQERKLLWSQL